MTKFNCELYISARLYFLSLQKQLKEAIPLALWNEFVYKINVVNAKDQETEVSII